MNNSKNNHQQLPSDWKEETAASELIAKRLVQEAISKNQELDSNFIEFASGIIHEEWLKRNPVTSDEYERVPYKMLPEEDKEKDRFFVKEAIADAAISIN
jgi:uncharacterized lipoprotein